MSRQGSSSPSYFAYSPGDRQSSDNISSSRRPSWPHSLSESTAFEDVRMRAGSQKRPRHVEDKGWPGSSPNKIRKLSYASSTPLSAESYQRSRKPRTSVDEGTDGEKPMAQPAPVIPPLTEEGSGKSLWEMNVKYLVGDAVGNMSMSPTSRDIVLAARRGLFIIDLDTPLSVPRFLPQGGTWDVADVQWNPHPSHAQYIVSTSSERLLIWNLLLGGKTSIQHILRSHYRAITDINWHPAEGDVVVSTGIDSWIWAWDLREPGRPIFGLSAFNAAGTQIKWNNVDSNLLASSHSNEVLIWDRRKGSLPVTRIPAHSSKIYGIDWSRTSRNEIVTCSLDKTIKTWDITATDTQSKNPTPKSCINTTYPVWRARNLPFGEGILALPQRSETTLEMYAKSKDSDTPQLVETFEGHTDVVKEFVWRKTNTDDFQLITWSKDRTLRFWPVDPNVMQRVGYSPEIVRGRSMHPRMAEVEFNGTFQTAPVDQEQKSSFPILSAPVGNRGILAEVRAPRFKILQPLSIQQPGQPSVTHAIVPSASSSATPDSANTRNVSGSLVDGRSIGGTMSKGGTGPKNIAQVDQLVWLNSVKVGSAARGSSGGSAGGNASGAPSRLGSRSRPASAAERDESSMRSRQRSSSSVRDIDDKKFEGEGGQSLQDELTTVLHKLSANKIDLEKHDLTKKRSCTLGLHGPWGDRSSVFIRVTFAFPRDYPNASYPNGIPSIELERNPLISVKNRNYILKQLRRIREHKRPCLEACLRFLLFADQGRTEHEISDSESSSDDEEPGSKKKSREVTVSLLRVSKNLAEPRTSQGVFGPNGELICFFRSSPRLVQNVLRDLPKYSTNDHDSQSTPSPEEESPPSPERSPSPPPEMTRSQALQAQQNLSQKTSYFQSPALVSDAVRRLGLAATDRVVRPIDPKRPETGLNILRAMTNLLTKPQKPEPHGGFESRFPDDPRQNYELMPLRRSTVFLISTRNIAGADPTVVSDYVFSADSLAELCDKNAAAAKEHGRFDHERIFRTLRTLFHEPTKEPTTAKQRNISFVSVELAMKIVSQLYQDSAKDKDVQMLAMIAAIMLQTNYAKALPPSIRRKSPANVPLPSSSHRHSATNGGGDYFSLKAKTPNQTTFTAWAKLPSPIVPTHLPALSSSNSSSRGSWTSFFGTGTMRQFMSGMQDSFKDGLTTPGEGDAQNSKQLGSKVVDSPGSTVSRAKTQQPQQRVRKDSSNLSPALGPRSWNDNNSQASTNASGSYSSSHRQSIRFSEVSHREKRSVVFEPPSVEERSTSVFDQKLLEQFKFHVYFYGGILMRWEHYDKRLELLKAVRHQDTAFDRNHEANMIGLQRICLRSSCRAPLPANAHTCPQCNTPTKKPACTICRLPVKGLSRTCVTCSHVTHISCWNSFGVTVPICPSGCGCFCTGSEPVTRPSTRLGLTPPPSTLLLADIS